MSLPTSIQSALNEPANKAYWKGTHRLVNPIETIARVQPFLEDFGITRVANVTGLDWIGFPVVMVCRPNSRSLAVSQGKGLTLEAAKASGLMESVELYHAENIFHPLLFGSEKELTRNHRVADVRGLPLVDQSRYHNDLRIPWIEGIELNRREPTWLPLELVSVDSAGSPMPGADCFRATSNGLASGNHLLEAISHGVCELVERDSTERWYAKDQTARRQTFIDLTTIDDDACLECLNRFERSGIEILVWETTSEIGIASFLCLISERSGEGARAIYASSGMGCHPVREVALLRALTEAAQSRLTLIAGSRDDLFRQEYEARKFQTDDINYYRSLRPVNKRGSSFQDVPTKEWDNFGDEVGWELARLRMFGFNEVFVVDLTKENYGVCVVRVIIPGLQGPGDG